MRSVFYSVLLAGMAFVTGCQSTASGPSRVSIYGQPCNTRLGEAGLCRTVYR